MEPPSLHSASPTGKVGYQQIDLLIRQLHALPTLPQVGAKLLELATASVRAAPGPDRRAARRQLVQRIRLDPVVTARLLSSAARETGRPAATVEQAADALGFDATRTSVLSLGVSSGQAHGLDRAGVYAHAVAVATAAELLAERAGWGADREEAFVCGLLHDLGKLALAEAMPKSFARVVREAQSRHANIADYERRLLGVDHAVFGRRLAAAWRLPQRVQEVIWLHRQPVEAIPLPAPGRLLVGLVGLADVLARQAEVGFSGNYAFPRPADVIARQLDISREALEDVARELPGRVQPRLDLLDLHAPADEKAYYNALADANAELGRLNLQLRTEAQRLSADARCTQLLGEFHQQFTSAAGVDETLVRIAATLARARDIPLTDETALLAYSVNSETHEMLALLTNGRDVREWQSLPLGHGFSFSRSEASPTPAREVLPTLVADRAELEPWLRGREYVHQPLVAGGNWIGGAMIPGEASDGVGGQASQLLADSLAVPLALVQERCRAMMLSEQLAGSSQLLADTQDQIAEAKTLASVGRMAAGAAHELNNPLAVVSGRAQLMKERAETQADRRTWGLIAEQSEQISDIVTELMEFANPPRPHPEHVRPEELLREAVNSFVSSEHPQAAAAEIDIREEQPLPAVRVDSGQIRAVLLELLGNAATAAPEPRIRLHIRADQLDGAVLVSVVDNGPGMDEQTLRQAYTPFFSLQPAGRRRGLGLPKAKRLVESNGGRIWIRSRVGQGTAVYLELPSAERSVAEEDQRHAYTPRTHRAGGG